MTRQSEYRDPLRILLDRESRSCKGCAHAIAVFDRQACGKGKKFGRRCGMYVETQGGEMLRRVRKSEIKQDTWEKPDGLQYCLECWKVWMGNYDRDLGIQRQKTLAGEGDGYGNEDTSQQRRENEIAEATDAMINSLRAHHRWATYRRCGISTAWRFPHLNFIVVAQEAEEALEKKLQSNIATRTLW